jgi:hypothetical protein
VTRAARLRRRAVEWLTSLAAMSFPRARRSDARVVRDCAREAIDAAGSRVLLRELVSLVAAGLRVRTGTAARDLWRAPWRQALAALTLPLSAAILVVWVFGFVPRYDHWPVGEGWAMLLGGSLAAVVGAALRSRWLTALGALATLIAAAAPLFGAGTTVALADTPSFFDGGPAALDFGLASLLPTLLLFAGALSLPRARSRRRHVVAKRLALGLVPALGALLFLLAAPDPPPSYVYETLPPIDGSRTVRTVVVGEAPRYPMPWIWHAGTLANLLGIALLVALAVTWSRVRTHSAAALGTGLLLASIAYPVVWVGLKRVPLPYWNYDVRHTLIYAAVPLIAALVLMRRGAAGSTAPS